MEFDLEWHLGEQDFVYNNLFAKNQEKAVDGLIPAKIMEEGQGGYVIALRHPESIVERMKHLSERIKEEVQGNALLFDEFNLHTSLYVDIWETYEEPSFETQTLEANRLISVLEESIGKLKPTVNYDKLMFDQGMAMAVGNSNADFLELVYRIQQATGAERARCSAHTTLSRFTKNMNPDDIDGFYALMTESHELGESVPYAIDVGYFVIKPNGDTFELDTYRSFEL